MKFSERNELVVHLWKGENLPPFSDNAYGVGDVLRFWRGARRCVSNLLLHVYADEHYFKELTKIPITTQEEQRALEQTTRLHPYTGYGVGGWTNRLETFSPREVDCHKWWEKDPHRRVVMMDLDTVFVRNCDWLWWEWGKAPLGLPMDPYKQDLPCSGVVTFNRQGAGLIWDEYVRARALPEFPYTIFNQPSEMMLMREVWKDRGWPFLEEGMQKLKSFKVCGLEKASGIPAGTDIVYMHGKPKLRDLAPEHPVRRLWEKL